MSSSITPAKSCKTSPLTEENLRYISDDNRAKRVADWVEARPYWSPFQKWGHIDYLPIMPPIYPEEDLPGPRTYHEEHFVPYCERTGTSDWEDEEEEGYLDEYEIDELFYQVVENNAWTLMWE